MISVSPELLAALNATANQPLDLYELYLDSGTLYVSTEQITWGGHTYLPKVIGRGAIKRSDGASFDDVDVTLDNVDTGMAQLLLTQEIEGRKLIIRKIDRTVANDSIVIFHGRMERASKIDERSASISATQLVGSIDHEAPSRQFSTYCPWEFKSFECGYSGAETECSKSWARCNQLGNTAKYGGFRFIPHSGTFQYQETEKKRFLLLFSRKKTRTITAAYNSVDDTPYDVPIPIILGRTQIAGLTIQHADAGGETDVLAALCVGTVSQILYCRANEVAVADWTGHHGQLGGTGTQLVDPRFPNSYPYNLLAYVGVTIPSDVTSEDPAPTITAVVKGCIVDTYDAAGAWAGFAWSDNPIWLTRWFMTLPLAQGGMGIPSDEFDDVLHYAEAAYCDALITDSTNDQKIYLPSDLPAEMIPGLHYLRYRSTGVQGADAAVDGPYSAFTPGVDDDTSVAPASVQVKRFTMNVAIAKSEKAVDLLFKKLLPSFRGYLTTSKTGKIQIRVERPVANSTVSAAAAAGVSTISVAAPSQFAVGQLVLIRPFTAAAEVRQVSQVLAGSIQFTAPTTYAHASGEQIHRVEMSFHDGNIVGSLEYPLCDRQPSTNRVTVKYVDAPAGFEVRELRINDYEHQAKVHKVNNEDVDGSAIDSYFQAWRIGQWKRAKARDLGKFVSFLADIKASLLEVGDIIAVSGGEVGLQAVPFRIVEISHEESDEVRITGQFYSLAVYDDQAPQATVTVPAVFPAAADSGGGNVPPVQPSDAHWTLPAITEFETDDQGVAKGHLEVLVNTHQAGTTYYTAYAVVADVKPDNPADYEEIAVGARDTVNATTTVGTWRPRPASDGADAKYWVLLVANSEIKVTPTAAHVAGAKSVILPKLNSSALPQAWSVTRVAENQAPFSYTWGSVKKGVKSGCWKLTATVHADSNRDYMNLVCFRKQTAGGARISGPDHLETIFLGDPAAGAVTVYTDWFDLPTADQYLEFEMWTRGLDGTWSKSSPVAVTNTGDGGFLLGPGVVIDANNTFRVVAEGVQNPNFTYGTKDWAVGPNSSVGNHSPYSPPNCGRVFGPGGYINQGDFGCAPGEVFELSTYARSNYNGQVVLAITFVNAAQVSLGNGDAVDGMPTSVAITGSSWARYKVTARAPANAVAFSIYPLYVINTTTLTGDATCDQVDLVRLEDTGTGVKRSTTGLALRTNGSSGITYASDGTVLVAAESNALKNGNFEQELAWWEGYGVFDAAAGQGIAGSNALRVRPNAVSGQWTEVYQFIPAMPNTRYRLRVRAKGNLSGAAARIMWRDINMNYMDQTGALYVSIPNTTADWTACEGETGTSPLLCGYLQVNVLAGPAPLTGTQMLFDNIEIEIAERMGPQFTRDQQQWILADQAVTTANLANLAVSETKLANLAVAFGKLQNAAVAYDKIADYGIANMNKMADYVLGRSALFAAAVIGNAAIADVNAVKVTAGEFNGRTLFLDLLGVTTEIRNAYDANYGNYAGVSVKLTGTIQKTLVTAGGLACIYTTGAKAVELTCGSGYNGGTIAIWDAYGALRVKLDAYGVIQAAQYRDANNVQVLTNRRPGWGSASGTFTRTGFHTATVTTAELAERVAALLADLSIHGLIGS